MSDEFTERPIIAALNDRFGFDQYTHRDSVYTRTNQVVCNVRIGLIVNQFSNELVKTIIISLWID